MAKTTKNKASNSGAAKIEPRVVANKKNVNGKEQIFMTRNEFSRIINNVTTLSRSGSFVDTFLNRGIDINHECRYPDTIDIDSYKRLYKRNGTANRVVKLWPEESWAMDPEIIENENVEETKFEKAWKKVSIESRALHYLKRVDRLSGIGEFGILLIGIDDGKELNEPVEGINVKTGESTSTTERKILYLKPFDQSVISNKAIIPPKACRSASLVIEFQTRKSPLEAPQGNPIST